MQGEFPDALLGLRSVPEQIAVEELRDGFSQSPGILRWAEKSGDAGAAVLKNWLSTI